MNTPVRILFAGDIVGGLGRRTLLTLLPSLRERLAPHFVVVNGENSAGGLGITPKIADQLFAAGIDVITLGNHTYRHRDIYSYLDDEQRILRPANFLRSQPGHGWCVVAQDGVRLGVVSLSGNLFMKAGRPAFPEADAALQALKGQVDHVLVNPTPRRPARRSAWAGTSTVASPPSSALTPTSPPRTRASSPAAPPTSPTSA